MQFPEFDPVLLSIGPLDIRWYALAYVAGIVLGWWYASRLVKANGLWQPAKPPVTTLQLDDLVLFITLGIILGGRLGYALFYQPALYGRLFTGADWGERLSLFRLWDGGMSFHGGLIGVSIAIVWFAWRHKVRLLSLGDLVAPAVPIGLFFGRLDNFINGELWGRETTVPWAIRFCNDRIYRLYNGCPAGDVPRHPSQLYEAALEGLLLFFVIRVFTHVFYSLRRPGMVAGIFGIGYGLARIAVEFVRLPDVQIGYLYGGWLTMAMVLSIPLIVFGLGFVAYAMRPRRGR